MINVKTAEKLVFPVIRAALLHNQVNRIGSTPFIQNSLFARTHVGGRWSDRSFFPGILVNKKESSGEVKNKAAAVVLRPFEHGVPACLLAWRKITGVFGR